MFHRCPYVNATAFGSLDEHRRTRLVEPETGIVEFPVKDVEVSILEWIDDVEHHVRTADDVENLSTATFSFRSTLNQTRQIQDLDFCTSVFHDARNTSQCCECIACSFGVCVGDLGNERGFTNGRETNECNRCITRFLDFESLAAAACL